MCNFRMKCHKPAAKFINRIEIPINCIYSSRFVYNPKVGIASASLRIFACLSAHLKIDLNGKNHPLAYTTEYQHQGQHIDY